MIRCLLVVDMLNDFIRDDGTLYCGLAAAAIIPEVQKQITTMRENLGKVVFVCDAHAEDDPEFEQFPPHAVKGQDGAKIIDELQVLPGDHVIEKHKLNAFYRTDLERVLRDIDPDEVHVVGVCTSICIMDVVSDLRTRDIPVVVHRDAVADLDQLSHTFALRHMAKVWGATVV